MQFQRILEHGKAIGPVGPDPRKERGRCLEHGKIKAACVMRLPGRIASHIAMVASQTAQLDSGLENPRSIRIAGKRSRDISWDVHYSEHFAGSCIAHQIDALAIPMVIEVASLDGVRRTIGIEQRGAFAALVTDARVNNSIGSVGFERQRLAVRSLIAAGIKSWMIRRFGSSQVIQVGTYRQNDLAKLRRPARCFGGSGHEAGMVMDRFEKCRLEDISDIEHAVAAIGEAARTIRAGVREWRHQIGRPVAAYPASRWHEVEITDRRHDPRVGFLLCGNQQRPIRRVRNVLEQVDRRKGTADDPDSTFPLNLTDRDMLAFGHQPPRSASR